MSEQIVTLRTEDRWRRWMMVGVVSVLTLSSGTVISERALFSPLADDPAFAGFAPIAYAMLTPTGGPGGPGGQGGLRRTGGNDPFPQAFGAIPQPGDPAATGGAPGGIPDGATGAGPAPQGVGNLPSDSIPGGAGAPGGAGGGPGGTLPGPGGSLPGGGGATPGGTTPGGPVTPPVSAVPEPASWAMMILGFAFIGGILRRQRNGSSRAVTGRTATA